MDRSRTRPNWQSRPPRRSIVVRDPKTGETRVIQGNSRVRQPSSMLLTPSYHGPHGKQSRWSPTKSLRRFSSTLALRPEVPNQGPQQGSNPWNHISRANSIGHCINLQHSPPKRPVESHQLFHQLPSFDPTHSRHVSMSGRIMCETDGGQVPKNGDARHDDDNRGSNICVGIRLGEHESFLRREYENQSQGTRIVSGYRGRRIVVRDPSFRTKEHRTVSKSLRITHGAVRKSDMPNIRRRFPPHFAEQLSKDSDNDHGQSFYNDIAKSERKRSHRHTAHGFRFETYSERHMSHERRSFDRDEGGNRDCRSFGNSVGPNGHGRDDDCDETKSGDVGRVVNNDIGGPSDMEFSEVVIEDREEGIECSNVRRENAFRDDPLDKGFVNSKQVVFVNNLSEDVTTTGLADLFGMVGAVKELRLLYDRQGNPSGSADVIFHRSTDALEAVRSLHKVPLNNRPMYLSLNPCFL